MGPRERHRIISSSRCRCTREEEKHRMERKRERERGIQRENVIRTFFFMCVCVCACASSGVFVSLNIALCAVCARATRSAALRSEEKTLEFVRGKRKGRLFVSRYHTLSRVKNRGKHLKKRTHEKRQERKSSFFWWWFFLRSFPLSKSVSFCSHDPSLSKKGIINL